MPKNSPFLTSNDMSLRACWVSLRRFRPPAKLMKRLFTELVFSCGNKKFLERLSTLIAVSSDILDLLREVFGLASKVNCRQYRYDQGHAERYAPDPFIPAIHLVNSVRRRRNQG